jgi:hypothetical protein
MGLSIGYTQLYLKKTSPCDGSLGLMWTNGKINIESSVCIWILYSINKLHWIAGQGKSKTCNGTKRNEIETKRNETKLFRFLFNIYLRVITNSRNCFVSFLFRFVSLISKKYTHYFLYLFRSVTRFRFALSCYPMQFIYWIQYSLN